MEAPVLIKFTHIYTTSLDTKWEAKEEYKVSFLKAFNRKEIFIHLRN